ncbi:hypothetical protein Tco_1194380 [Tanacetum coccineum]
MASTRSSFELPHLSIKECFVMLELCTLQTIIVVRKEGLEERRFLVPKPPQKKELCNLLEIRLWSILSTLEEERRIADDQAAKDRYWKIPICYDDDED